MHISFIGAGNMASALIGGLLSDGLATDAISAVDPSAEQCERISKAWQIQCFETPAALAQSDVIVLSVKPQLMEKVSRSLAPLLNSQLLISIAAGIRARDLSRWLGGHQRIVRCMPNTPALIGRGITGLAAAAGLSEQDRNTAERILTAVGETVWVDDESQLDAVTAISGSGPAYVFYFMELLEQAARQTGLSAEQARQLTLATFRGAAELAANSDEPPSVLRTRVTSKGGTTAAALDVLSEGAIADAIGRAVNAAATRSREMGVEFGAR